MDQVSQILSGPAIYPILVWTIFWKGIALWNAAKNDQKPWFVVILVLNSLGLVEIIYLLFFQTKGRYWNKIIEKVKK